MVLFLLLVIHVSYLFIDRETAMLIADFRGFPQMFQANAGVYHN
jgi:hypothetical protein